MDNNIKICFHCWAAQAQFDSTLLTLLSNNFGFIASSLWLIAIFSSLCVETAKSGIALLKLLRIASCTPYL